MSFDSPYLLLLLLAVPVAVFGLRYLDRRRAARSTVWAPAALQPNMVRRPPSWRRAIPTVLLLVGVALLLVGFARPTASFHVKSQEATVALVLDVSGSMAADDSTPTRIAHAKQLIREFMQKLPHGYEMSLVSFSDHSSVLAPPTHDLTQIDAALRRAQTGPQGTALAEAVVKGLQVVGSVKGTVEGKRPPGVVVVLSDGGQTSGRTTIAQATQKARGAGIPVSTILLGTPNGLSPLPRSSRTGTPSRSRCRRSRRHCSSFATGTSGSYMQGDNVDGEPHLRRVSLGSRVGQRKRRPSRSPPRSPPAVSSSCSPAACSPAPGCGGSREEPRARLRGSARRCRRARASERRDERVPRHSAVHPRARAVGRRARARLSHAEYLLTCPGGRSVVGGLDAQVTSRAVHVMFDGQLGAPVQPGVTTTRYALFHSVLDVVEAGDVPARSSVASRFRVGRAIDGVGARHPTGVRYRRALEHRVVIGPGNVKFARIACTSSENLVDAWHAVAFLDEEPPPSRATARARHRQGCRRREQGGRHGLGN